MEELSTLFIRLKPKRKADFGTNVDGNIKKDACYLPYKLQGTFLEPEKDVQVHFCNKNKYKVTNQSSILTFLLSQYGKTYYVETINVEEADINYLVPNNNHNLEKKREQSEL